VYKNLRLKIIQFSYLLRLTQIFHISYEMRKNLDREGEGKLHYDVFVLAQAWQQIWQYETNEDDGSWPFLNLRL